MTSKIIDNIRLHVVAKNLEKLLTPIIDDIGVRDWFPKVFDVLGNLLKTFEGNPDKEWWSHILSWNKTYGSGIFLWIRYFEQSVSYNLFISYSYEIVFLIWCCEYPFFLI